MERTLFAVRYSRRLLLCAAVAAGLIAVVVQAFAQSSTEGQLRVAQLGDCRLQSGNVLHECRVGYRTFGRLNAVGSNAVLMPTWLYGTSADLNGFFGNGPSAQQLVDTSRFFGIAVDALGNGVSSSPSNTSDPQHGPGFPAITTRDMVQAEYRLVTEVLHLKHLHAVVGLSMGGEQTFVWAVDHPHFFDLAIPILGTPRLTSYDLQVKRIMIESIVSDPDFKGGRYTSEPPLKLANLFGNLTVTSPEERNADTSLSGLNAFFAQAEAPLSIDANDRLAQLKAITHQDVIGSRSIAEAARATTARFLVIVNARDHLVNPQPALDWAAALQAPTYISHGTCAHLIMNCDAASVSARARDFLLNGVLAQAR
jgi:homoserine O-acetyltransferase/O-succinyltransferase